VAALADVMGFDSAWYGWAQVERTGTVIHASSVYNLPDDYFSHWTEIADQDVLVHQFMEDPTCVPLYDRFGEVQTDGMEHFSDTFGISQMTTAMCLRRDRTASFFLSAYRGGAQAKRWSDQEREFLQCAIDNISFSAQIAARRSPSSEDDQTTSLLFSRHGATLIGLSSACERFGHLWSRHEGDRVPRWLSDYVGQPGEHILVDQELVARCELIRTPAGPDLFRMSLRPMRKIDLLTERERHVARVLANGYSHKEAARLLGVAPSTVRNQIRSIYGKLEIDNRASLAMHVLK
jgi:DNA-binding CsgD family transcriptional regulator